MQVGVAGHQGLALFAGNGHESTLQPGDGLVYGLAGILDEQANIGGDLVAVEEAFVALLNK